MLPGGLGSASDGTTPYRDPYRDDDDGIFITRVIPGGPADLAGLKIDDKILSVDGYTCVGITHHEAVCIFMAAISNVPTIEIKVLRETRLVGPTDV